MVLSGSALSGKAESRDIDLAVEGVADKDFYAFYGELMCMLSKPVDLIDLSRKSKFTDMVLQEGIPLHAAMDPEAWTARTVSRQIAIRAAPFQTVREAA